MKALEGFTVVELTEDRIVQEKVYPTGGKITIVGNPHPDPEERQKNINELAEFLEGCRRRIEAKKRREQESQG